MKAKEVYDFLQNLVDQKVDLTEIEIRYIEVPSNDNFSFSPKGSNSISDTFMTDGFSFDEIEK